MAAQPQKKRPRGRSALGRLTFRPPGFRESRRRLTHRPPGFREFRRPFTSQSRSSGTAVPAASGKNSASKSFIINPLSGNHEKDRFRMFSKRKNFHLSMANSGCTMNRQHILITHDSLHEGAHIEEKNICYVCHANASLRPPFERLWQRSRGVRSGECFADSGRKCRTRQFRCFRRR